MVRAFLILILALVALLAGCVADTPSGAERILAFHADITVLPDGALEVTETIRVRAAGEQIRHGIFRDFTTLYRGRYMERIPTAFEVIDVARNGVREPHHLERDFHGVRLYLGSSGTLIPAGEHEYRIRYRSSEQILHFDGHDELYWNVTGSDWTFQIEQAGATVRLPAPVAPLDTAAWTGRSMSTASEAVIHVPEPGRVEFAATVPLAPGSGFTILVALPRGLVSAPSQEEQWSTIWRHNGALIVGLLGALAVWLYYLLAWLLVGRDPPRGVIIPQYEPPPGLAPGAARYVANMGYDDGCMVADLVDAAVRGRFTLDESASRYSLELADRDAALEPAQARLVDTLFERPGQQRFHFEAAQRETLRKGQLAHEKALREAFQPACFRSNRWWLVAGLLLSAGILLAMPWIPPYLPLSGLLLGSLWAVVWGAFALVLVASAVWTLLRGRVLFGLFLLVVSVPPSLALWLGTPELLPPEVGLEGALIVGMLLVGAALFAVLLKRPTRAGRALMDRLDGLKLYLGMAEREELAALQGPEPDADRYQRLLPWAMALEVEDAWTERFSRAVGRAQAEESHRQMRWRRTDGKLSGAGAGAASSIGNGLARAIASARPSSSSGRSGGGRSGGGRGGGGGGGW